MKGSLVALKMNRRPSSRPGIVMSNPVESPPSDFMDAYRPWEGDGTLDEPYRIPDRTRAYVVQVYWPHDGISSYHRLSELDFLNLVR